MEKLERDVNMSNFEISQFIEIKKKKKSFTYLKIFSDENNWCVRGDEVMDGHFANCSLYFRKTDSGKASGTNAFNISHEETLIVFMSICWKYRWINRTIMTGTNIFLKRCLWEFVTIPCSFTD